MMRAWLTTVFAAALVALLPVSSAAVAQDYPARRAGHWQITLTLADGSAAAQVIQQCVDADSDRLLHAFGGLMIAGSSCASSYRKDGASIHIDTTCKVSQDVTTHLQTVFTGDFNSNYTVRATTRVDGDPGAAKKPPRTVLIAGKWLGACAADQRPGDILLADGKRMNVLEFKKTMDELGKLMKHKSGNQ
jgi:uncharacterized protein DUF3617